MKSVIPAIVKTTLILIFVFLIRPDLYCQKSSSRDPGYAKTAVVPKKQRQYKYLLMVDTKDILYGNKCATMVTHRYGFEYLPVPKSQLVTERESSVMFHNLFTNLSITLRHGIWWKFALKRKIKECQNKSRDMNG
jgi:hypothetical protein